jgi:hypothetical protein
MHSLIFSYISCMPFDEPVSLCSPCSLTCLWGIAFVFVFAFSSPVVYYHHHQMGRNLSLHAVPDVIEHDESKPICLDWDYEREPEEMQHELSGFLKEKGMEVPEDYVEYVYSYSSGHHTLNSAWCPACAMFSSVGIYQNPLLKASKGWGHSYGNPIWSSDWHFYNMHPGSRHSDFVNKFRSDSMFSQIEVPDLEYMEVQMLKLGRAHCTADREAVEETKQFIDFSRKWLQEPDTIVLYELET